MNGEETRFSKENRPKPRGIAKRTALLNALRANDMSEGQFYEKLVKTAVEQMGSGKTALASEVLERLYRTPKQTMPTIEFDLKGETPVERANSVLDAVAAGDITPDEGMYLTNMIQAGLSILEVSELAKQVEEIKEAMANDQ